MSWVSRLGIRPARSCSIGVRLASSGRREPAVRAAEMAVIVMRPAFCRLVWKKISNRATVAYMSRTVSAARLQTLLGSALDRSPAYLGLADGLRLLVSDGRVPPGTRLPSERELTTRLGVSRTTVTRAYAVLRDAGYLESRQGSGSVVRLPTVPGWRLRPDAHPRRRVTREHRPLLRRLPRARPASPPPTRLQSPSSPPSSPAPATSRRALPALKDAIARRYDGARRADVPRADRRDLGRARRHRRGRPSSASTSATGCWSRARRTRTRWPRWRGPARGCTSVSVDPEGWESAALLATVRQAAARAAFLIPDFHNPTGALMPDELRARLAARVEERGHDPDHRRDARRGGARRRRPASPDGVPRAEHGHRRQLEQGVLGRAADRLAPRPRAPRGEHGLDPAQPRPRRAAARAARPRQPAAAAYGGAPAPDRAGPVLARGPRLCTCRAATRLAAHHSRAAASHSGASCPSRCRLPSPWQRRTAACCSAPVRASRPRAGWSGSSGCPTRGRPRSSSRPWTGSSSPGQTHNATSGSPEGGHRWWREAGSRA